MPDSESDTSNQADSSSDDMEDGSLCKSNLQDDLHEEEAMADGGTILSNGSNHREKRLTQKSVVYARQIKDGP